MPSRITVAIAFFVGCLAVAPLAQAAPRLPAPPLANMRATPLPVLAPPSIADAIAQIGGRYRVAVVAFVPAYKVDLSSVKPAGALDQALGQLAEAIDGHVQQVSPVLYAIVPNFRVDAPSAPLVPQVHAAVQASNGLAYIVDDLPDAATRARVFSSPGISVGGLSETARAAIMALTIRGRPLRDELWGGATGPGLMVWLQPEWIVTVRYGTLRLGSYDAWEQSGNTAVSWDANTFVTAAQIAAAHPAAPIAPPSEETISIPHRMLTVNRSRLTANDLAKVIAREPGGVIIDSAVAGQAVAITRGVYDSQLLLNAICRSLQLTILEVKEPSSAADGGTPPAQPRLVVTGAPPGDDDRIVHEAVDREIVRAWSIALAMAQQAMPVSSAGPFGFGQCAGFATLSYRDLNEAQKVAVDGLLPMLPVRLSAEQAANITVAIRPGLVAQGRVHGDLVSTVEQSATIFADVPFGGASGR
ncbi:MAG: hypothetical protein P4L33_05160 [Capsulimonadaceae bacterium]|nr:hypothetical protein [Capsulimonadaceae bacterium]